jgi:signal peptidase I
MMAAAILGAVVVLGLLLGGTSITLRRRYTVITVRGQSMLPTYADGDRLLVRRTADYGRDDVIVFPMPADRQVDGMKWLIKRVTAVAGDSVPADVQPAAGPGSVPRGCVVVHGDADSSLDSRQLGYIASASGLGVVVRRLRS